MVFDNLVVTFSLNCFFGYWSWLIFAIHFGSFIQLPSSQMTDNVSCLSCCFHMILAATARQAFFELYIQFTVTK